MSSDKTALLFDVASNVMIGSLEAPNGPGRRAAFSVDGQRIVAGSHDGTVRIWDGQSGKPVGVPFDGHSDPILGWAFSRDSQHVITVSQDETLRWWDAASGRLIRDPIKIKIRGANRLYLPVIEFSPDRSMLVAKTPREMRFLDTMIGTPIGVPIEPSDLVGTVTFSPDGDRLLIATDVDTLRVWDRKRGKQVTAPLVGRGPINGAAFNSDGSRIIAGFGDNLARVWDVFPNTQALVRHAKAIIPRCLTNAQRYAFFLPTEPPAWCIELGKWPYHTEVWKQWLSEKRSGKNPPLPRPVE